MCRTMADRSTLGLPMRAMAALSLLFMPPLYVLADLSPNPLWNKFTLFKDSSTAWLREHIHVTKELRKTN